MTQLGGRKRKTLPIRKIASAAAFAVRELGSARDVTLRVRHSASQINDFVAIDSLPADVKARYLDGGGRQAIGIEVASELSRLHDVRRIRDVAGVLVDVNARDGMQIVDYARRNPNVAATECKKRVLGSKNVRRHLDILVVPLEKPDFQKFRSIANRKRKSPVDLAKEVLESWIHSR